MLATNLVRQSRKLGAATLVQSRRGVYWGHHTLEEQEAEKKKELEKAMLLQWTDPDQALDAKKTFYSPMRIEQEEKALSSGYDKLRFNSTDWFSFTMQPIVPYLSNPPYYYWKKRIKVYNKLIGLQYFVRERLTALGPDLAAAHFLIARGCRVKFRGKDKWFEKGRRIPKDLPETYVPGWYVEKIDASDSVLIYEGFQNLRNLVYLKSLDLSNCPLIDAWCLDRITGEYSESLEELNLSGCQNLNWNGLECLWRLRKLKKLILRDMEHVRDIKLICLMLLDIFPDLDIQGVDYIDTKLLEGTEHQHLLSDLDVLALLPGAENPEESEKRGEPVEVRPEKLVVTPESVQN